MSQPERIAGRAALTLAALSVFTMIIALVVLPVFYGFRDSADLQNAANVQRMALPLFGLELAKLASAVAAVPLVLGLGRAWPGRLMRWAASAGLLAALLLGLSGLFGALSLPPLQMFGSDAAMINRLINALGLAAIFANGLWAMLACFQALRLNRIRRGLAYLGMLWGAAGALAVALAPLALVALFLGLLWQVSVVLTLLRGTGAAAGTQRA